ncbi:DUF3558 domain-containing protein [Streptomyces kasugaensis]|uniref:DUF3558 domain-containing protein n=1 Tax=Streptomyces kasugaensis TaxID=1946 RepID=A0A4Q9HNR8_STRKA|nr:DUF3558 domain-containing protein [Streptomyces kasugaensis]TBO56069.1 DUF3558 domain-containing protein [Streptomyces kasugaensis]
MHRSAKRLAGLLTCAAVPVMLVAGCSGSGTDSSGDTATSDAPSSKTGGAGGSATGSTAPSLALAKFKKLPNPCEAFSQDTIKNLLPKVKNASGEQGKSSDNNARGYCAWNSSDAKGVDGTQYRWLDVSYQRYDSEQGIGTGEKRATEFYAKKVDDAKATEGAKNVKTAKTDGTGDEATSLTYESKKDGNDFGNATVVMRTANVVITLNYNGAGLAGADTPKSADLLKSAQAAAKEAVTAVNKANG